MLYNERQANVYRRAASIVINNPLPATGLPPDMRFIEQDAIIEPDGSLTPLASEIEGYCGLTLTDESRGVTFPLLHPETGDPLGESTYEEVATILYSLYAHAADLRDSRVPAEPTGFTADQIDPVTGLPLEEYQ